MNSLNDSSFRESVKTLEYAFYRNSLSDKSFRELCVYAK